MTATLDSIQAALATVNDPEIRKPITELGMVESVGVDESGRATVTILLTISGCPLKETLTRDATAALLTVEGVTSAAVPVRKTSSAGRLPALASIFVLAPGTDRHDRRRRGTFTETARPGRGRSGGTRTRRPRPGCGLGSRS